MRKKRILVLFLAGYLCFGAAYAEKISENAQISDVSFSGVDVGLNSVYKV